MESHFSLPLVYEGRASSEMPSREWLLKCTDGPTGWAAVQTQTQTRAGRGVKGWGLELQSP